MTHARPSTRRTGRPDRRARRARTRPARRLVAQLVALEVAALAFCRLLERWARGEPDPSDAGDVARPRCGGPPTASRRRSPGLEQPLGRYLLELEADSAEGRSWFGEPGAAELVDWEPVLDRAGVQVAAASRRRRVSRARRARARARGPRVDRRAGQSTIDAGSLWAGLFDLRENLLGRALDDLRAIAA